MTGVFITPDDKGRLTGHFQRQYTFFESYDARSRIKGKGKEAFFKELEKGFVADIEMSNTELKELDDYSAQLVVDYDFKLAELDESGMIYLQPMFSESMRSNPFKSAERKYPVEMPAVTDYNYTLSLTLPEGCEFEELPKSSIVKFNDGEGIFQYLVQQTGNQLMMRSRLKFNRAWYEPEEYQSLREFYDVVVKKHAEQVVIKKKKHDPDIHSTGFTKHRLRPPRRRSAISRKRHPRAPAEERECGATGRADDRQSHRLPRCALYP